MPTGLDGVVMDVSSSDDDTGAAVSGAEKELKDAAAQNQSVVQVSVLTRNAVLGLPAL